MDIITSIISKIGEMLVEPTGRHLGYLFHYKVNIKALEDENVKLMNKRADVQKLIDAANRNSEVIGDEVNWWVSEVDKITDELEKFLKEDATADKMCFHGWCPNLKLRHSLGRKAKKHAEGVLKLQQEGKFDRISYPAPPTRMHFSSSSMKDFNSRKKILNQVMEALRNEKVSMTAICGMGGIGKTTMAKEVAKRAKDEKLFREVVMVTVSQNPNVGRIQDTIADFLGLKFDQKSDDEGRAEKLRQRILKETENILLILDDLWNKLDLEAVGIPDGCKILLASRNEDVCKQMKSQEIFPIKVLSEDEAWNLFEEVAGISNCTRDLHKVAKKVANECKGLPVAIVTVGRALENRDESDWNDALLKLEKSIPDSMLKTDIEVYSRIKLSYDLLRSEEAKSCFLLCCLFPEDYDIGIETLVRYGKGLRLFQETRTMEQTRNRVHTLVGYLKRCFLLMDGNEKECIRMHDIVRDVAISIASRKEHDGFVVKCDNEMEEWPEIDSSEMEHCTAISLVFDKRIKKHPDSLVCPNLKLLSLSSTIKIKYHFMVRYAWQKLELSENFFEGIKEIKVLAFQSIYFQTLPASLQMLQNLRTLHLEYCELGDISRIGGLEMLEILSLIGSWIQQELPKEIGNLQHLKVLDMTKCKGLNRIPPGVLSRLTTLEELKIFPFSSWSSLEGNEEKTSASLDEITPLLDRYLKVLNVWIPEVEFIPRNFIFNDLTRFSIGVGRYARDEINDLFRKNLQLDEVSTDSIKQSGIHPIVKKCEALRLRKVHDLKNLFPHFDEEEQDGFPWLRILIVVNCNEMEYVVKFTSNNNRTDLHVPNKFPLLEELYLMNLEGLKGIFHYNSDDLQLPPTDHQFVRKERISTASSLPRGFPQLQSLYVGNCPTLEEIVSVWNRKTDDPINTSTSDDMILFPKLTELTLWWLPSLISLCRAIDDEGSTGPPKDADGVESNMDNMNTPTNILVPFKCIKWLPSLEKLEVNDCDSIKVLFGFHGNDSPQLDPINSNITNNINVDQPNDSENLSHKKCCLIGCLPCGNIAGKPNMIQNSQEIIDTSHLTKDVNQDRQLDNHKEEWLMNLKDLDVIWCNSLEVVFDYGEGPLAPALNKLESLELRGLYKLMHIWKKGPQQVKTVGFQNLKTLSLHFCPSLRYLFTASIAKLLVMLKGLKVTYCKSMEEVVAKTEEEINNVNAEFYVVSFPNLVSIELNSLNNLYYLCQHPYAFEFPSLETLQIKKCPKLQTFVTANKTPKIPKLKVVKLNGKDMVILEQDLNGIIRRQFEKPDHIEEE
ncbi:disease resistance protein At4g27190 isoform X2 [Ziziphus jujuba]|nr:disease resistance protein At4g27190 isoform X2 [Ziziphus jujuba]